VNPDFRAMILRDMGSWVRNFRGLGWAELHPPLTDCGSARACDQ
jgi:hypothetical protein